MAPTEVASMVPSTIPTNIPTGLPSGHPSSFPSSQPSKAPTPRPTPQPTPFGSISGRIGIDTNNDNAVDKWQAGATVKLLSTSTGQVLKTTTTNSNGWYSFGNLAGGSYYIEEMDPSGYVSLSNVISVNVPAGSTVTGQDLMDAPERLISGVVMYDVDKNGSGDNPVGDVIVSAVDSFGNTVSVSTDNAGVFSFSGLFPGVYDVRVTGVPDGYGLPADVSVDTSVGDMTDIEIVIPGSRTISGYVKNDLNRDDNGDEGIGGVTLAYSVNGVIHAATTDSTGAFEFSAVPPGIHTIELETIPDGYGMPISSTKDADTNNGDVSDFEYILPGTRVVSGSVMKDLDYDGDGDEGMEGVTVVLVNKNNEEIATETSGANGLYTFDAVVPDQHTVRVRDLPSGYVAPADVDATASIGDPAVSVIIPTGTRSIDASTSMGDAYGYMSVSGSVIRVMNKQDVVVDEETTDTDGKVRFETLIPEEHKVVIVSVPDGYALPAGQNIDLSGGDGSATFVLVGTRSIAGTVMVDTDGNGTPDAGVNGVVVAVFNENANEVASMPVGTHGAFTFDGLAPRQHTLTFTMPSGYAAPADHTVDLSGGNAASVVIEAAGSRTISGTVKKDYDNDGTGDEGMEGVTMSLTNGAGVTFDTVATDNTGAFEFTGAIPRVYRVVATVPSEYTAHGGDERVAYATTKDVSGIDMILAGTHEAKVFIYGSAPYSDYGVNLCELTVFIKSNIEVTTGETDDRGVFNIESLVPEDHTLRIDSVPSGWVQPNPDTFVFSPYDGWMHIYLRGERSLSGTVYADTDNDGNPDSPVSGVSVQAEFATTVIGDPVETLDDGKFTFSSLAPIGHTIKVVSVPDGYSLPGEETVDLSGGDGSATFVLVGTRSIAGTVLVDVDGNGTLDAGVNGVVVAVFNENVNEVASMPVGTHGGFTFDGLAPREYTLTFTMPSGYAALADYTVDLSGGNADGIVIEGFVKS